MRANENIALIGDRVILVPYRHDHVARYHQWMTRPDLLEATASEPLSLEEEYEMQRKWHLDEDKLTFIVLALPNDDDDDDLETGPSERTVLSSTEDKRCKMIGDVNLFIPDGPEGDVECEVMIAEDDYRGKGIAKEALSILLNYATTHLPTPIPPTSFLVRISSSNASSLRLFDSLGFTRIKLVRAFDEVEMRFGRRLRLRDRDRDRLPDHDQDRDRDQDGSHSNETNAERGSRDPQMTSSDKETVDLETAEAEEDSDEDDQFEVLPVEELDSLTTDRWRCVGRMVPYPVSV